MALRRCLTCTALFAVGLFRCPQCGGTDHEEDSVRITKAGPSTGHPPADRARGGEPSAVVPAGDLAASEPPDPTAGPGQDQGSTPPPSSPASSAPKAKTAAPTLSRAPKKASDG
jgi:hypothetical protein